MRSSNLYSVLHEIYDAIILPTLFVRYYTPATDDASITLLHSRVYLLFPSYVQALGLLER
jgi:hypothetical protein